MAARAGVRQSVENPWVYFETSVTGTLNLLELCREDGVKKFVLAATSSLYGANNPRPFRDDANTDGPLSPYAASKKAAEALCYTYHYLYGIDVTVLRYFTVCGPARRPDMSLFRFVQWISEGRSVIVYGDGKQQRDFTYVADIARGTLAALRPMCFDPSTSLRTGPSTALRTGPSTSLRAAQSQQSGYEVINRSTRLRQAQPSGSGHRLGSDQPVVLMDAIRLVEELVGKRATLEYRPRHPADVLATWADIPSTSSGQAGRRSGCWPFDQAQDKAGGLNHRLRKGLPTWSPGTRPTGRGRRT